MMEAYGSYPVLGTPPHHDGSLQLSNRSQHVSSSRVDASEQQRKHAACDECRKRKLKCSGEPSGCSRCVKNAISCIYSQQKQMGRPRKRQKPDGEDNSPGSDEARHANSAPPLTQIQPRPQSQADIPLQAVTPIDPSLSNIDQDLTDFQNVCPGPLAQAIRGQREAEAYRRSPVATSPNFYAQNGDDPGLDFSNARYPTDIALWPDFSTLDKLPIPLTSKYSAEPSDGAYYAGFSNASAARSDTAQTYQDPDVDPSALASLPSVPACPCLPNLYLSLSTLSTLTSFPISQHTVDTLLSAHKTAHAVIYCHVCPRQFNTGSQNLMLGCTLLNVLADHWHRVNGAPPEALKKGFSAAPKPPQDRATNGTTNPFITVKEGVTWRNFVRQIIRAYVFGDASAPSSPNPNPQRDDHPTTKIPSEFTLTFLISALERRQRQWHRLDLPTDEFPDRPACQYYHNRHYSAGMDGNRSTEPTGNAHGASGKGGNGDHVNEHASVQNGESGGHGHSHRLDPDVPDTLLCLMIVEHSREIMKQLDEDLSR